MQTFNCYITTIKGLEEKLATEFQSFNATNIQVLNASISCDLTYENIIRANLASRLANRILLKIHSAPYANEQDIYDFARTLNWDNYFAPHKTLKITTNAINSPLRSLEFATLKLKDAICDYFNQKFSIRPDIDKLTPQIQVFLFLTDTHQTLFLDTSRETLFKRGYRQEKGVAPLRENLASGLIKLSNWDYTTNFYDPMCGSGTIAIEALLQALRIYPNLNRDFAFKHFIDFNVEAYEKAQEELLSHRLSKLEIDFFASDIDANMIAMTSNNLNNLGLQDKIKIFTQDFLQSTKPSDSGIIISNLPYGVRLEDKEALDKFYPTLGDTLKKHYTNWQTYWLSSDRDFAKLVGLRPSKKTPIMNGDLDCRLYKIDVISGFNRK